MNRTVTESERNDAQGRPAGLLLAWLNCAADTEFEDKDPKKAALKHMKITRGTLKDIAPQLSPAKRLRARRWAIEQSVDLVAFLDEVERERRPGEPLEPDRCP